MHPGRVSAYAVLQELPGLCALGITTQCQPRCLVHLVFAPLTCTVTTLTFMGWPLQETQFKHETRLHPPNCNILKQSKLHL